MDEHVVGEHRAMHQTGQVGSGNRAQQPPVHPRPVPAGQAAWIGSPDLGQGDEAGQLREDVDLADLPLRAGDGGDVLQPRVVGPQPLVPAQHRAEVPVGHSLALQEPVRCRPSGDLERRAATGRPVDGGQAAPTDRITDDVGIHPTGDHDLPG